MFDYVFALHLQKYHKPLSMKYLILSDIHGSLPAVAQALTMFEREHCDMLCLLGDILNYGPRNGLPEGLDPQGVAEKLNSMANRIVAVRGNCDSEVDQMLLHFPIMADYALLVDEGKRLLLTHGHNYDTEHRPTAFEVMFCGHTHLWQLEPKGDFIVCNTGSPTFPKGGNPPTFAIYDSGTISVHTLDGKILKEVAL